MDSMSYGSGHLLDAEQQAAMRALWGQPGSPFESPDAFARMLEGREQFARHAEQWGAHDLAREIRRNNVAMRAYARRLGGAA